MKLPSLTQQARQVALCCDLAARLFETRLPFWTYRVRSAVVDVDVDVVVVVVVENADVAGVGIGLGVAVCGVAVGSG